MCFLLRTALSAFSTLLAFVLGTALTRVNILAHGLADLHQFCTDPPLKPVKVPLDGISSLYWVDLMTESGVTHKLAEGALNSTVPVSNKEVK